ncbi:DUF2846 domain-containing protein [Fibrisoma montanum]|uniref:DUF2846 domain-containing protein n=1 Tax=Fibrisoma montanum TaxID=2305895 RepID=A0A418LYX5_9BACT|nr:DUF2846 domain-containing protein [Fibrisoma montanum]RIV18535.1 DUF2846 domain-containing protein [Fibrisoma montanum]
MKVMLLIPLWLLITGLFDDQGQPRNGQARVIIYRQREFGSTPYDIAINDKKQGALPTNRYMQVDILPGRIKIESMKDYFSDNQTLWLNVQAGHTYYVKAVEDIDFLSRTLLIAPIGEDQAQRELRKIKPLETASTSSTN